MEDRYLFKAKRIDNGEWVQGVPFEIEGKQVILIKDNENLLRVHYLEENMWAAEIYAIEVDKSTICQCTGLKDKNGKLIWENDIVKATVRQNSLYQSSSYSDFYQISYQEKYCYFYLKKKNNNLLFDGNWSYYLKSIEVIGNIFDNKETLESEEK